MTELDPGLLEEVGDGEGGKEGVGEGLG